MPSRRRMAGSSAPHDVRNTKEVPIPCRGNDNGVEEVGHDA
jgi:hypothetical protein